MADARFTLGVDHRFTPKGTDQEHKGPGTHDGRFSAPGHDSRFQAGGYPAADPPLDEEESDARPRKRR